MQTIFSNKRITGILSILPELSFKFEDETSNFPVMRAQRLKSVMGYGERRRVKKETTSSDLCVYGLNYLFEKQLLHREEIGAVVVTTLTPDYFVPHVSNIIHGECGLGPDVICMDIPQACTGYILGLLEAMMLLDHMRKKVLLFTVDVLHRKEQESECYTSPPFGGDCATVSILENAEDNNKVFLDIRTNGAERNTLLYPAGAFKFPQGFSFQNPIDIGDGVMREPYELNMDGTAVFNYVQREVPPMIMDLLNYAGATRDSVDYYLFHQPNRFMLEKLAEKLEIPKEKMFMNIVEKYGNSNSSTIPMVITENLRDEFLTDEFMCCLSGFGAGLSLGGIVMRLGKMDFCRMIESNL